MDISDFNRPDHHPYGMLPSISNGSEKELLLAQILVECINRGDLYSAIEMQELPSRTHTIVSDGLLDWDGDTEYRLTKKAIGLLYSEYGK